MVIHIFSRNCNLTVPIYKNKMCVSGQHLQQLCDYLELQELEKQNLQLKLQQEINDTLSHQASQPTNNAMGKGEPLNLESCGSSSLQCFIGEDDDFSERKKMQQRQIRQWCSQSSLERSTKYKDEKETENEHAKCILQEDRIRCEVALEELRQSRELKISIMNENKRLAKDRRRDQQQQIIADNEKIIATLPFFSEDTDHLRSVISGRRIHPDQFKRLDFDQMQSITNDNKMIVKAQEKQHWKEKLIEHDWDEQLNAQMAQMDKQELKKLKLRAEDNNIQIQALKMQQREMSGREKRIKKDRFGEIGKNGFFQKFGR